MAGSSSFQQKLLLKGSDETIDTFTNILKQVKDIAGLSTATAVIEALDNWNKNGTPSAKCAATERSGRSRGFQLTLLTSAEGHMRLSGEIDKLKRDTCMELLLMRNNVGKEEWLLEAFVVTMEQLFLSPRLANKEFITRTDGLRCAVGDPKTVETNEDKFADMNFGITKTDERQRVGLLWPQEKKNEHNNATTSAGWRSRISLEESNKPIIVNKENLDLSPLKLTDIPTIKITTNNDTKGENDTAEHQNEKSQDEEKPRKKAITAIRRQSFRRIRRDTLNSDTESLSEDTSMKRRKEKRKYPTNKHSPPPSKKFAGLRYDISLMDPPIRTTKDRKESAKEVLNYLSILTPDERVMPGFKGKLAKWDRHKHGVDCDEVYPGIVLGNGATVKKPDYLRSIGISHVLNAAEFRGVNVGEEFYAKHGFKYKGIRIEDTPQTQICRHFMDVAKFLDSALSEEKGKIFVNCVFGKSRSTTCVVVFLMLKLGWGALKALKHIRMFRPVEINEGFLQQVADLDFKMKWYKNKIEEEKCKQENICKQP